MSDSDAITPRYSLGSIHYSHNLRDDEVEEIQIRHKDGTLLLTGCGDCGSPMTEDRAKLDELIRLANVQAEEEEWEAHNW